MPHASRRSFLLMGAGLTFGLISCFTSSDESVFNVSVVVTGSTSSSVGCSPPPSSSLPPTTGSYEPGVSGSFYL